MRLTNCYLTLAEFKATAYPNAEGSDTADDTVIKRVIENISRALDRFWEGRHYYPRTETRVYTAADANLLLVDDLLTVTTLKTDSGDRSYATTWQTTDYDLAPYNAVSSAPPRPYTRVVPSPNGSYRFPSVAKGVQLAGSFGYFDVKYTADATLTEDLDTSETGVDVSNGAVFSEGMTVLIDSEQMHVQTKATGALTVTRGANGTTAASHTSGAAIQIYEYPTVNEAAMILASRIFKRKDAPFGVLGSAEMGQMLVIAKHDPDVMLLMRSFRKGEI